MERAGFEPATSGLQRQCGPNRHSRLRPRIGRQSRRFVHGTTGCDRPQATAARLHACSSCVGGALSDQATDGFADSRYSYMVRSDGSGLKRLTRTSVDEIGPAWAPNGREILYTRARDLWQMKPDASPQRLLLRSASSPSWSPAGTHIAFVRGGDPWSRRGEGARRSRERDLRTPLLRSCGSPARSLRSGEGRSLGTPSRARRVRGRLPRAAHPRSRARLAPHPSTRSYAPA